MKYFFDTEFREDGTILDLISIAIVADDGREFYAVSSEFDIAKAVVHPFLSRHVLPHIGAMMPQGFCLLQRYVQTRRQMAAAIQEFVGDSPEFWADYAAYDWVALCQLYGTMMDLPDGWPMFCRDIQQLRDWIPFTSDEICNPCPHFALNDARECRDRYLYMEKISLVDVTIRMPR
jgi:hypothetical protein